MAICNFISWIEYQGKIYFLDDNKLNTKEGRKLPKPEYRDDILGHGAIRKYYPELKNMGQDKECEDFSNPKNFPPEIVKAIKRGLFESFSICPDILLRQALAEYEKIQGPALAEYEKIEGQAFWKIARQKKNRKKIWK